MRESIGNSVFFTVYEYVRYHMHLKLQADSYRQRQLIDFGIGVISGGLGGVAVSIFSIFHFFLSFMYGRADCILLPQVCSRLLTILNIL